MIDYVVMLFLFFDGWINVMIIVCDYFKGFMIVNFGLIFECFVLIS